MAHVSLNGCSGSRAGTGVGVRAGEGVDRPWGPGSKKTCTPGPFRLRLLLSNVAEQWLGGPPGVGKCATTPLIYTTNGQYLKYMLQL